MIYSPNDVARMLEDLVERLVPRWRQDGDEGEKSCALDLELEIEAIKEAL